MPVGDQVQRPLVRMRPLSEVPTMPCADQCMDTLESVHKIMTII